MARMFCNNEYETVSEIEKIVSLHKEYQEQTLAEIIQNYDFIVSSRECESKLMKILPDGANIICLPIICSPYIESPTTVYAIKKFDVMDLLKESKESEDEK